MTNPTTIEARRAKLAEAIREELAHHYKSAASTAPKTDTTVTIYVDGKTVRISDSWLATKTNMAELDYESSARSLVVEWYAQLDRAGHIDVMAT